MNVKCRKYFNFGPDNIITNFESFKKCFLSNIKLHFPIGGNEGHTLENAGDSCDRNVLSVSKSHIKKAYGMSRRKHHSLNLDIALT